jgi:hypothetical protein
VPEFLVAVMQQIADWRENLGMCEYADCFAKNHIELSALPDLTNQDLEKLGVLLGDRRKMLRAITALNTWIIISDFPTLTQGEVERIRL